jgi:hypothetical protein
MESKQGVQGVYGQSLQLPLDKGDAGIDQTAAAMTAVIHSAAASPIVDEWTRRVILPIGANAGEVASQVFWALKSNLRFKRDPKGVELLRHPDQLVAELNMRAKIDDPEQRRATGDCDDVAMLGCAMLLVCGIDCALIVMEPPASKRREFEHVYFGAVLGPNLMPLDPQETNVPGVQRAAVRRKAYRV